MNPMLSNSSHSSRFARGINLNPIHAQVPEFTPGELLHACRNNIECRVDVSVVSTAAFGALPLSDIKPQFIELMAATATCLARWKPTINGNQSTSVPLALVLQLPSNLSPSRVADRSRKPGVLNHVFDFQIFDANHIEVSNQSRGQLVRLILALIPDFRVGLGDSQTLTFSPLATLLFAAQGALLLAKVSQAGVIFFGVFDLLAVAQGRQVSQSEVNTDNLISDRQDVNLDSGAERHVILAVGFSLQSDHDGALNLWESFSKFDSADFWQFDNALSPAWNADIFKPKASGCVTLFVLREPRPLPGFHPAEKMRERRILVSQCLGKARRRGFGKPRKSFKALKFGDALINTIARNVFLSSFIGFLSGRQRMVPNPTNTTEPSVQHSYLCAIRIGANLIASLCGRHTRILQQKWSHNHDHP